MTFHVFTAQFRTRFRIAACVTAALAAGWTTTAAASDAVQADTAPAQFVEDIGASERINYSGKLRMLSQRIVAASCYLQSGVSPAQSRETLDAAVVEFALITDALEFGNADLGIIGVEERPRILAGIAKLREYWTPIADLANTVIAGQGTNDDIAEMAQQSELLLDIAKRLVVQISGQYANQTSVLQSDAFAIDLAGRQRMLSQRISKNTCLLENNILPETAAAELAGTSEIFEATLTALYGGMTEAGINPPPNEDISAGIALVIETWTGVQPVISAVAAGEPVDPAELEAVFLNCNKMTGDMNTVVGMYAAASKMGV